MSDDYEDSGTHSSVDPTDTLFAGRVPIREALHRLRLRLLDLTGRNQLLNFKPSVGKSLQFVNSSPETIFKRLLNGPANASIDISPVPEPPNSSWVRKNGRLVKPDAKEHAMDLGYDTSYELPRANLRLPSGAQAESQAKTLFYAEDLGKHCRKIDREARLAIEKTGANMLYLVFGFLEYPDTKESDKLWRAPLVSVPVKIEKVNIGQYTSFSLVYTGEELADNLSLLEKVRRDYSLSLPEFEEDETSLADYFEQVEDIVSVLPQWRVRRSLTLSLLSFSNMLLVRDLDPDKWPRVNEVSMLMKHDIVRQVFEGSRQSDEPPYGQEYAIDEHVLVNLPLIYDADSSQHSALIDVADGKTLVIEGPPGTGKSQTITNLIATALFNGKKVLFVSEKLAALEVVKSRLAQAGLEHFILELHSNKANKKRILEDLAVRLNLNLTPPVGLTGSFASLEAKRVALKEYSNLLNSVSGNAQELTVHQILWKTERFRRAASAGAGETGFSRAQNLIFAAAPTTSVAQFSALYDLLTYITAQHGVIGKFDGSHPFWGFFPVVMNPGDDLSVDRILREYSPRFDAFADAMQEAVALLGGEQLNMSAQDAQRLIEVLTNLAPARDDDVAFDMLPRLFSPQDPTGTASATVLADLRLRLDKLARLRTEYQPYFAGDFEVATDFVETAAQQSEILERFGVGSWSASDLVVHIGSVLQILVRAQSALSVLSSLPAAANVAFDGSTRQLSQLEAIFDVASAAPMSALALRHSAIGSPTSAPALFKARIDLSGIRAQRETLSARFYFDALPDEPALREAISVLRQGDAWFRLFQPKWRGAMRLHRTLEREKSKVEAPARLADLEAILRNMQDTKNWDENPLLRAAAGQFFQGEDTPLEDLHCVAQWCGTASERLVLNGIAPSHFDPSNVDVLSLGILNDFAPTAKKALSTLTHCKHELETLFAKAHLDVTNALSNAAWPDKLVLTAVIVNDLKALHAILDGTVTCDVVAADGLAAISARYASQLAELELDSHPEGKRLLEGRFKGAVIQLEPIEAAHLYGCLIKKTGMAPAVEALLVSEASAENYVLLTGLVESVQKGWAAAESFSVAMSELGKFDLSVWAAAAGKDMSPQPQSDIANELAARTHRAIDGLDQLFAWSQYLQQRAEAYQQALLPFVDLVETGALPAGALVSTFSYRFYASIAQSLFRVHPELARFSGLRHSAVRAEYAALDRELIKMRGQQVAVQCKGLARPPGGVSGMLVGDKTEMELLRHLIPQQKPRVPVRKMLKRAGRAIQELKPCFMMGPQAVAQFLEPGQLQFDIIVMDEASQLKPEQAIGAIARGSQLVVVGDPKQLPPTSFFSRTSQTDGDDGIQQVATDEAESILDVCIGHFRPVRSLRWHYRSRHESLIAFSNHYFYRGNLFVFPSPYPKGQALGLRYHYVADGVYEGQMNRVEAQRVVDAVVEHIVQRPGQSLGVVTLNVKQRDLIAELLEARLPSVVGAEAFETKWQAEGRGLFIKNLENVQGDERDCIMISTTFGKLRGTNVVRQNFGPISREGGWRRLNVLFTRARNSVAVFSSMRPDDIIVDNSTPVGTVALRNYLEYARKGILPQEVDTQLPPESDFEVSVIEALQEKGFHITPQLGVAGFRIDIAVKHPDYPSGYLAAVECDGASYHTGVSVRDRDRIRQEILESLGWKGRIWRIWSTDWFRNPGAEAEKLFSYLEALRKEPLPAEFRMPAPEEPAWSESPNKQRGVAAGANEADAGQAGFGTPVQRGPRTFLRPSQIMNSSIQAAPATAAAPAAQDADGPHTADLLVDENDMLEVEVGDLVSYVDTQAPDDVLSFRLTAQHHDLTQGLVAERMPLAQTMLGATVGETVVLRVPGQAPLQFKVKAIKRLGQRVAV